MHVALLYSIFLSILQIAFSQGLPTHSVTTFEGLPQRLFFFDDSESAIYFDSETGIVHVSQDEGKSWKAASEIEPMSVVMLIEHPFDNKVAFALTKSTKHYRTMDRGKTWQPFDMKIPSAIVPHPLSFHIDNQGYILYQGTSCKANPTGWGQVCLDETYYTKNAFGDEPKLLLSDVSHCQFAHSSKEWKHEAHKDLIYCVAFDSSAHSGSHSISSSRLFSSTDWFENRKVEDLGIGNNAKGVVAFAIVSKFALVALKDLSPNSRNGEMLLYVTTNTETWAKALFPHASSAQLRENAYTILESTTHSLAVDVVLQDSKGGAIGNLFVSNSNGTYFVQSLADTNRNDWGYVDFERVSGVEGVGLANIVSNAQDVEGRGAPKKLRTRITFNDGRSWEPLEVPANDQGSCGSAPEDECSLNLHSVTNPHNYGRIFSSPAPGLLIGVGSVSPSLPSYSKSNTYLSTDAGRKWRKIKDTPHKFEFGDSGSIIVVVSDEDDLSVEHVEYSLDFGESWNTYKFGRRLRSKALITVPDSTSQKFVLIGEVEGGKVAAVYLDFSQTRSRECKGRETSTEDFEKWYARPRKSECIMGHKQYYTRRKPNAQCYVGHKFVDPVSHEEDCECGDEDFECDFNYVRSGDTCVEMGPEPIPANTCPPGKEKYFGSSGWRKIPGNTCTGGKKKDEKIEKDCSKASPPEGSVIHQTFTFPSEIVQHAYFKKSRTILVRLMDGSVWQSQNEGYNWQEPVPGEKFVVFYHHKFTPSHAYLLTRGQKFYSTINSGRDWKSFNAPLPPNAFSTQVLRFHPTNSDRLIWTGNKNCEGPGKECHAEAHWSNDHGDKWSLVETYVKDCAWAADTKLNADPTEIICESYRTKGGNQRDFNQFNNALELIEGKEFYKKKKKAFDRVVGFAKFSEYLVVAALREDLGNTLELQVSLDGVHFAQGLFPPSLDPRTHAYTVLESSTNSLFLHMTTSERPLPYWGHLLKSNSNGTYFNTILQNVNRNDAGFVDFEKVIGLDGIALVNVVANPNEAIVTGRKEVQTRITHNDGGSWKPLQPPSLDSQGNPYPCREAKCMLNVHGYTERRDPRATYSSPSTIGVLLAVGNVGETLAPYEASDTFLSRDAGFTWTEIHKDAHLWEFGDSGSILVLANDEHETDHILFSTDEGLNWREYKFTAPGEDKVRVWSIVTVHEDTSRRFILLGRVPKTKKDVAIHVDFSALTTRQCLFLIQDPQNDDFEKWSPSEQRNEVCLFGKKTIYHRRKRDANCIVGEKPKMEEEVTICPCSEVDFECEFNHVRDESGECVLVDGTTPLPDDGTCRNDEEFWWSRTAYRKIPYSQCDGGDRPDQGAKHPCPGFKNHSGWFWFFVIMIPFAFTALVGWWYYNKSGMARGTIRLPGDGGRYYSSQGGFIDTLASVPWFLIGIAGIAWEWVVSHVESLPLNRSRRGYRDLPADEDAHILRFEDEE